MSTVTRDEDSVQVKFAGMDLVWLKNADGSGALAPPEHVDEAGGIKWSHILSESYAHVCSDGRIRRYGADIGGVDDLELGASLIADDRATE